MAQIQEIGRSQSLVIKWKGWNMKGKNLLMPWIAWSRVISTQAEIRAGANFTNCQISHQEVGNSGKGSCLKQFVMSFAFQRILRRRQTALVLFSKKLPYFRADLTQLLLSAQTLWTSVFANVDPIFDFPSISSLSPKHGSSGVQEQSPIANNPT